MRGTNKAIIYCELLRVLFVFCSLIGWLDLLCHNSKVPLYYKKTEALEEQIRVRSLHHESSM